MQIYLNAPGNLEKFRHTAYESKNEGLIMFKDSELLTFWMWFTMLHAFSRFRPNVAVQLAVSRRKRRQLCAAVSRSTDEAHILWSFPKRHWLYLGRLPNQNKVDVVVGKRYRLSKWLNQPSAESEASNGNKLIVSISSGGGCILNGSCYPKFFRNNHLHDNGSFLGK